MAVVTEIRHERKRVYLLFDHSEKIVIPLTVFQERPFKEGDEVDQEEYDQWLMVRQYRFALERAVGYLAQRPCSKKEISDKLLHVGYRPCTVEMVLYKLEKEHLLNDADFAVNWAESRSRRQLGRNRIAQELRMKGISSQDAEEALEQLDPDEELKSAITLAARGLRRAKAGEDPRKTVQRVIALLARHGYSYEIARKAVEMAAHDETDG